MLPPPQCFLDIVYGHSFLKLMIYQFPGFSSNFLTCKTGPEYFTIDNPHINSFDQISAADLTLFILRIDFSHQY